MCLYVSCCIKYKSSLEYKAVYDFAILYLRVLMMIGPKVLKDWKNNQTNP